MRRLVLAGSLVGVGHFLVSLLAWSVLLWLAAGLDGDVDWSEFYRAVPAAILFVAYAMAVILAWKRRRGAGRILGLAILASGALFAYDTTNDRYQIQALTLHEGCKHYYCTWWWWTHDR